MQVRTNSGLETPLDATPSPLGPGRKAGLSQRLSKIGMAGPASKFQVQPNSVQSLHSSFHTPPYPRLQQAVVGYLLQV